MTIRDSDYLKGRFEKGDTPSESDFGDLIDTVFRTEEGIVFTKSDGKLVITVDGVERARI